MNRPKKSLCKNFLNNENILNKIIENGDINTNDIILEIGPGTGKLTEKIIQKKPEKIIVVEKDRKLSEKLDKKYGKNLELINGDILDYYDKFKFNKPIKVFGNLPYYISTKILTSFIKIDDLDKVISKFLFVFQKEVADRIIAKNDTKQYGRLAILTSWKMKSSKILDISPKNFFPVPKVWSALVLLKPKTQIEHLDKSKSLEHVTNIFFNQRRKMVGKPMRQLFKNYQNVADKLNIDLKLRPQNLTVDKYIKISKFYENSN